MQPRVTKRDRKLILNYQLPHRVHCAEIYPLTALNGSTVIIYGHERGLRICWRGGRRHLEKSKTQQTTNGNIDDDFDTSFNSGDFEAEEDELDSDCPYPAIIQDLDIPVGAEVWHIAVPEASDFRASPRIFRAEAVIAIASTDGAVIVIRLPLAPPSNHEKDLLVDWIGRTQLVLTSGGPLSTTLSLKIGPSDVNRADSAATISVAFVAGDLHLRSLDLTASTEELGLQGGTEQDIPLAFPAKRVAFSPAQRTSNVLTVDSSGSLRVLGSSDASTAVVVPTRAHAAQSTKSTRWLYSVHAPFRTASGETAAHAALSRRKQILDAKFVFGGKRILALLEDGEWGLWDVSGVNLEGKRFGEFVIRGYLSSTTTHDPAGHVAKPQTGSSRLAPTTPNTRKVKAANLFTGAPKPTGAAIRGGISVASSINRNGSYDESVVIWYGSDIYTIPNMQSFWQRHTSSDGSFGSLYAPGLTHIPDIDLSNEDITAISQFQPDTAGTNTLGAMNVQRDLLVATEYQMIILQSLRPSTPARSLFQRAEAERPTEKDQHMLDAGELDLGGMDRLLDSMVGRPRRVEFAE